MNNLYKLLSLALLIICIGITLIAIKKAKYSISEAIPQYYNKDLKVDHSSSLSEKWNAMEYFFKRQNLIENGNRIISLHNWKIEKRNLSDGYYILFVNKEDNISYVLKYANPKSDKLTFASISCNSPDSIGILNIDEMIENSVKEKMFIYANSRSKNHPDLLIKEFSDNFLIIEIIRKGEKISVLNFQLYKRSKYF